VNRLTLVSFCIFIAGCQRSVAVADFPGTYVTIVENIKQEIKVQPDGTYTNTAYRSGALLWSDSQKWQHEEQLGKVGITFTKFRFEIPGHSTYPGYWFVVPSRSLFGTKRLCYDIDLDRCFEDN
jgi:hypothetical protein